ncbi:ribonuclease H2 subunit C [Zerene cesonia]|uniref:ribonuclease H2 subunit C n=1 Tax=Zerene cesonia TaxID=33412 RepID=UPI0018E56861|nr:ribonuclease H2 subunit C [Zerene cesonia]
MSIQVDNNLKDTDNQEVFNQKVHYMPCKIEEDGHANVQKYFSPYIQENENGELTATFRGHSLDGVKMPVPEGYRGIVVTEAKRPLAEDADRKFQVAGGFKEIVYWNWDKKPSKNDNIVKAMDWIDIAEAIHGD